MAGLLALGLLLVTGLAISLFAEQRRLRTELRQARAEAAQGLARATELAVVDAEGAVRARLGVDAQGAAFLELSGPGEASGLRLQADASSSAIQLRDARVQRVELGWRAEPSGADRASLRLVDRAGQLRGELMTSDAVPVLNLYNEHGVQSAGVP